MPVLSEKPMHSQAGISIKDCGEQKTWQDFSGLSLIGDGSHQGLPNGQTLLEASASSTRPALLGSLLGTAEDVFEAILQLSPTSQHKAVALRLPHCLQSTGACAALSPRGCCLWAALAWLIPGFACLPWNSFSKRL